MEAVRVRQYGLWGAQRQLYQHHTGRFVTSWLFTALNPLVYGWAWAFRLIPGFTLGGLTGLLYWVSKLSLPQLRRWQRLLLATSLLLLYLSTLTNHYEALYWFTGIVVYQTGTVGLLLLGISAWYHCRQQPRAGWPWVLGSLAVVGSTAANEVALAQAMLFLLLMTAVSWTTASGYPNRRWWLWLLVLGAVSSALSLLAPGNYQRMDVTQFDHRFQLGYSVLHTLVSVAEIVTRPAVWLVLVAVAGYSLYASRSATGWQLHPVVAVLYWVASIASGFFSFWWLGFGPAPARTENAIIGGAMLSLAVLVPPVARWARSRRYLGGALSVSGNVWWVVGIGLVLTARSAPLRAWQQLRHNAWAYEQQMQRRYQRLHAARRAHQASAVLPGLKLAADRDIFMHPADLDTVAGTEHNLMVAAYFGLDSVRLASPLGRAPGRVTR
ncbi:DUF6056 family protein [Hymenobacter sp. 102]|uniref:DUF6056 family protein n=1 Tax=Hymenobacter sp. 102 TaxID=3403152 RepID=UPI003CF14C3C